MFAQSSPTNCTVYAGGCTSGDENALRRAFGQFGRIMEVGFWEQEGILYIFQSQVRYFKDKGYAFVRFDNKESACNAIVALHLTEVLHLFWVMEVTFWILRLGTRWSSAAGGKKEEEPGMIPSMVEVAAVIIVTRWDYGSCSWRLDFWWVRWLVGLSFPP